MAGLLHHPTASVDWLTVTTADPARAGDWQEVYVSICDQKAREGFVAEASRLRNYEGGKVGRLFVGSRGDGWIVQITSDWADSYGSLFQPDAAHCTRIDLALTIWLAQGVTPHIAAQWERAKAFVPVRSKPPLLKLWTDKQGPQGFTTGARTSELFTRTYDKQKESGEEYYTGAVRYEVELKGSLAVRAAAEVYSANNRRERIRDMLVSLFAHRGIRLPVQADTEYQMPDPPPMAPDVFMKLRWLREGVSPTVRRLIDVVGVERVIDALFAETAGYLHRDEILGIIMQKLAE